MQDTGEVYTTGSLLDKKRTWKRYVLT